MEWQLMTAEQKDITGLVRKFLENELAPLVQECDGVSRFPMEVFKKMGEIGLWGMDIPAEYGGPGFDLQTLSLLREEFGRVDFGFAVSFGAATVGFKQVLAGGSEEQKRAMAERLVNGEISAMCITEPQSGSDVAGTKTKAVRVGDEYIINGTKTFITNGGLANVYVVVASTNPELGHKGLSCFIVERTTPGVSVGKEENKTRVMSENEAYEMTVMLEGVIDYGTGTAAALGRPAAGKTGTTDDNKDAWFVGYTPDIVTAVWIGDDTGAHSLGEVYGGTIPAEIWKDYMSSAAADEPDREFAVPAGMERMRARTALSNNSARVADDSKKEAATEKKESDDKEKTDEKAESRSEEASRQPSEEARRQQEDSNNKAQ